MQIMLETWDAQVPLRNGSHVERREEEEIRREEGRGKEGVTLAWSAVQSTTAVSSGESEYYALLRSDLQPMHSEPKQC